MGATVNGKKELIGITEGYRESEQSWLELLRDLLPFQIRFCRFFSAYLFR